MSNIFKLIISIALCQLAGIIGSFFTMDAIPGWYAGLNKPGINPPNWIFGPVWITLYFLMGISLFLVWKEDLKNSRIKKAFIIFMIQLVFNTLWSVIFFGTQSIAGGLIVIVILWILIMITINSFIKISKPAAALLMPYLLWVSFAALLNYFIFKLN
ncbi:MAG: tryptophan-rich sensory protein [Bacteroidetes bacterium]|nr:tryptophan-rich sensory protein [Bacteroidota bacterium]